MQNGMALKFATDIVKTARDVVLAAVTNDWRALAYANRDLHNDRAFMRAAISLDWHCLQFGSRSIQSNEKILLTAVYGDASICSFHATFRVPSFLNSRLVLP